MSSARVCLVLLALVCLSALVSAAPASRLLQRNGHATPFDSLFPASPDAQGVTLQLFMDSNCLMNISTADTLNSPINTGCQSASGVSYNLICTTSGSSTNFAYSVYATPSCSGAALTSITSAGTGKCLPTTIVSNGQPAPIPIYATVQCNLSADESSTTPVDVTPVIVDAPTIIEPVTPTTNQKGSHFNPLNARRSDAFRFGARVAAKARALSKASTQ